MKQGINILCIHFKFTKSGTSLSLLFNLSVKTNDHQVKLVTDIAKIRSDFSKSISKRKKCVLWL